MNHPLRNFALLRPVIARPAASSTEFLTTPTANIVVLEPHSKFHFVCDSETPEILPLAQTLDSVLASITLYCSTSMGSRVFTEGYSWTASVASEQIGRLTVLTHPRVSWGEGMHYLSAVNR